MAIAAIETEAATATAGRRRQPGWWPAALAGLALLTIGAGLGTARRLSYHEAIVAQGARELLATGELVVPTLDGRPWLEKPPLSHWLVAAVGGLRGGVDEAAARLPSALAAAGLALVVSGFASRHYGSTVGRLAGAVQLTSAWAIDRGRLADADMLLALLVAGTMASFDRLRSGDRRWRWAFFGLLGATGLAKGIGFGAALAVGAIGAVVLWDRDRRAVGRLLDPAGLAVAALVGLAWPLAVVARYPEAIGLWMTHVGDRVGGAPEQFVGEPLGAFLIGPLLMGLPWSPFAVVALPGAIGRARRGPGGPDRLLLAWAFVPLLMLAMAGGRNGHYLIHALPPWSIWAALGLRRLGDRLRRRRGWSADRLRRSAVGVFGAIGLGVAGAYLAIVPGLDDRGQEWSWYAEVAGRLRPDERLVLLYDWDGEDPWDRLPYPTPFGPVPHDLAVRLYYLDRPASWRNGPGRLAEPSPFAVVARERDLPALRRLGAVEEVCRGPDHRWDRSFALYRVAARGRAAAR